ARGSPATAGRAPRPASRQARRSSQRRRSTPAPAAALARQESRATARLLRSPALLVERELQTLAGRELRHLARRDLDFSARLRIAAGACSPPRNRDAAEAHETHVPAPLQFPCDRRNDG